MAATPTDVPWWSNLVSVTVALLFGIGVGIYIMRGGASAPGAGPGWLKTTFLYLPHALILFGFIADMLTYEGVYWIPSFITLVITPLMHKLFGFIWGGAYDIYAELTKPKAAAAPAPAAGEIDLRGGKRQKGGEDAAPGSYTGCDIQGFEWARTRYGSGSLAVIATFFSYYIIDLANNRGGSNTAATAILGIVAYLGQFFLAGDCSRAGETPVSRTIQFITPLIEGLFVGGVSYSVVQGWYPSYLPSSAVSPFPRLTPRDLRDGKFDKDGNPYVCVGGNCYPDLSTKEAQASFAQMAAASTGNGQNAIPANCPASS